MSTVPFQTLTPRSLDIRLRQHEIEHLRDARHMRPLPPGLIFLHPDDEADLLTARAEDGGLIYAEPSERPRPHAWELIVHPRLAQRGRPILKHADGREVLL